jgi:hypothetical protein
LHPRRRDVGVDDLGAYRLHVALAELLTAPVERTPPTFAAAGRM